MEEMATKKKKLPIRSQMWLLGVGTLVVLALIAVFYWLPTGVNILESAYYEQKEAAEAEIYETIKGKAFDRAEKAHHVTNRVLITLGRIEELQKLEVLRAGDVFYDTAQTENQNLESWLEIPGTGIFTVDLQIGEFIIDQENCHVLVRVPQPELTNFTIDYANLEQLYKDEHGFIKGSAGEGTDLAMTQLKNGELQLMQRLSNNQELYQQAMEAADTLLTNLVKQINPDLPDLMVDVEFYA